MTFVAQPYERFVDDLLIALTGGTIREEHEFTGIDRAYSLGRPDVVVESLRVFGERNGEFALFQPDVDYRYDAEEDAVAWQVEGNPPDDRTYFYVSYFTTDGDPRLTDRNPGSVTTTLAEAFARQYGVLHKQMEMIYRSAFVELASERALDHIAALLDVERRDAKFASGEVLFKRSTPAPGDIAIPVGTLVSTAAGVVFETTAPRTLRRDQLSVVVPIRAQSEGPDGAVPAEAIAVANRPIYGIEGVLNERPTFFTTEREPDEELRGRIRGTLHRAGRSTVGAIRNSLIERVPGLTEANVQVSERVETPGVVEVRLGVADGVDEAFVRRVDEAIFQSRPAGVRVSHNLSTPQPAQQASPTDGAEERGRPEVVEAFREAGAVADAEALAAPAEAAETVLPLRVEVLLRLAQPNLTAVEREAIESRVRGSVVDYVKALPMGSALVHAKLLGAIAASDDVADASMLVGPLTSSDARPAHRANVVAADRKLTVDPHEVAVYLMDQRVRLDVRVRLTDRPAQAAPGGAGATAPRDVSTLRGPLRAAIEQAAATARGTLTRDGVRTAVGDALGGAAPELILTEHEAVVVNATYEETGRIVSDATEITLQEHEVAVVGEVEVERMGVLDG